MIRTERRFAWLAGLALISSLGTLVCCALPALLVALGAGAVMASLVSAAPQIVLLSEHKLAVFATAALLIATGAGVRHATRNAPCPVDSGEAETCRRLRRSGGIVLMCSAVVLAVGFFFAFVAPLLVA